MNRSRRVGGPGLPFVGPVPSKGGSRKVRTPGGRARGASAGNGVPALPGWGRWAAGRRTALVALLLLAGFSVLPSHAAQPPLITEFMAANASSLRDQDGDASDWIEIYNPEPHPISLAGYSLTDDRDDPEKWRLPGVALAGQAFLVVFASGKDRRDPTAELHTSFALSRDGEYLALFLPDGRTAASEFAPAFPRQLGDLSYGLAMHTEVVSWVAPGAQGRFHVPTDARLGTNWVAPDFDDSTWFSVGLGMGYDRPLAGSADVTEPPPAVEDVTRPDDLIVPTSVNSPTGEDVTKAIDGDARTKYLNRDKLNAGFAVTPSLGPTVVVGLRLTSANDAPDRDPTSYVISGSNDGRAFYEIARGALPNFSDRFQPVEVSFVNTTAYRHYRLLFPTVRNAAAAVAVQIAEVEFLGWVGSAPADFASFIRTDVGSALAGRAASACLRLAFSLNEVPANGVPALFARYEDGFVAWLNGQEIARANAPGVLGFEAVALTNRLRAAASVEERFPFDRAIPLLRPGRNVLAIQGLNHHPNSRDFLIEARLEHAQVTMGELGYFESPTPGGVNAQARVGLVGDLTFSPPRGFCEAPVDVSIQCATEGATIRYTRDGSTPSLTHGALYTGAVRVTGTTPLRAMAFRDGWRASRVATHTYVFVADVVGQTRASALAAGYPTTWSGQVADYGLDPRVVAPAGKDNYGGKYARTLAADLRALPSLSLVMERDDLFGPQGIYAQPENRGEAWERPVSLELLPAAGEPGFQENAGIRIQGGAFRRFDLTLKKSFRVVFREKYGATELEYPLFGTEAANRFDNVVLRANSNDAWPYAGGATTYVRDTFAMDTARAMGMVASHARFVHLYLNGLYWGLYNPVERPDAAFSATYHGGDKDTWDALNQDSVPDGNDEAWRRLLASLASGVTTTEAYQRLQGNNPDGTRNPAYEDLLEVENLIDYMILNFYVGNTDWPHRNWWAGRDRNGTDGFWFYPWDTETALGFTSVDTDVTGVSGAVAQPYAALRGNREFQARFGDRVYQHFFNGGALAVNSASPQWNPARPEDNRPAARFAALRDQVSRAIVGESARWGDQMNTGPFTRDEHWQRECDRMLADYFPRRSGIVLEQLRRIGLYPRTDPPVMNQRGGQVAPGFQLTLAAPQGAIYYTTNGSDPRTPFTVQETLRRTLVSRAAPKRVLVPSSANGGDKLGTAWLGGKEPFNDNAWIAGTGGVGYDVQTDYLPLIQINVGSPMTANGSAFIRIPFDHEGAGTEQLNFLTLRAQYDDGFVAYLNGVRIASANAPAGLTWNTFAAGQNSDAAAVGFEEFNADAGLAALKPGRNILAVQGMNNSLSSSDFLIAVELVAGERLISTTTNAAIRYAGPITLDDLTTIKARVLNGQEWSALEEATFIVGTPELVLTELHFHPAPASLTERAAGFSNADDFEFVELWNRGATTSDLNGVRFIEGIQFDFTGAAITRLGPGDYVLVVKSRAAFELRYGTGFPVAGEYSGRLDNAGETVALVDARGETVARLTYGTRPPWREAADGDGPSLEVIDPAESLASAANWRASGRVGGSPGAASTEPPLVFEIESVSLDAGQLHLRFHGRAGVGYTVYVSGAPASGEWTVSHRGAAVPQSGPVETSVEFMPHATARCFRVSLP